jgi:NiFe hydrogenase small subunit HydA
MNVSRRAFLKYCGAGAAALGLGPGRLQVLAATLNASGAGGPKVIWLKGSSCDGCSISFLNRISDAAPVSAVNVLTDNIDLIFHGNLSAFCGETAVAAMERVYEEGGYILVVEGGVPLAFDGHACIAWSYGGREVTFKEAVLRYAGRASNIVCAGTCAAFGGIPASGSNPTQVVSVQALTGRTTVNISGCPANPDWLVWPVVQLLTGGPITLDSQGRPTALYQSQGTIHSKCPRRETEEANRFGQDGRCLKELGCRGPATYAKCAGCWNGKAGAGRWCIGANAPCHGCVEPTFPGPQSFYAGEYGDGGGDD